MCNTLSNTLPRVKDMPKRTGSDQTLSFRLSPALRTRIEAASRAEDRPLSSFLRLAAMDRADRVLGQAVGHRNTNDRENASQSEGESGGELLARAS